MHREKGGIQLKKQAFHHLLRKQHLNSYFSQIRQQMVQQINKVPYHPLQDEVDQMLKDLPQSCHALLDLLNQQGKVLAPYLSHKIRDIADKMVDLNMGNWSTIVTIINKLLVRGGDPQIIEKIISQSLIPVLDGCIILSSKHRDSLPYNIIMTATLDYCYRLGTYLKRINVVERNSLGTALNLLWNHEWDSDGEMMLLATTYNILATKFDEEEQENVDPYELRDLNYMKVQIIESLFESGHAQIKKLIGRTAQLALEENENELLTGYLRVLIQLTLIMEDARFYYCMINHQIVFAISSIFLLGNHSPVVLILAIRLLNNLLVNDFIITATILKQLMIHKLFALPLKYPHLPELQVQLAQLFINLMHFMNDDGELIRELADAGVGRLLVGCLELQTEQLKDDYVAWVACSITIMRQHCGLAVRKLIIEEEKILKYAIDKFPHCAAMIEDVLASIHPQGQLVLQV